LPFGFLCFCYKLHLTVVEFVQGAIYNYMVKLYTVNVERARKIVLSLKKIKVRGCSYER
jgi:hypothetical protein